MAMMNKRRLSKILVSCDLTLIKKIAEHIEASESVQMQKSPQTALVMMKAKDSVSTHPFYMGEVLVTECTVSVKKHFGIGVVAGEQPERAYLIAVVDAACNAGIPVLERWAEQLEKEELRVTEQQELEAARVSSSKVNFDTMGEYDAKH